MIHCSEPLTLLSPHHCGTSVARPMGPTSESAVNALLAAKGQANDGLEEVKEVQEDAEMKAIDEGESLTPDGPDKLRQDDELRGVKLL